MNCVRLTDSPKVFKTVSNYVCHPRDKSAATNSARIEVKAKVARERNKVIPFNQLGGYEGGVVFP